MSKNKKLLLYLLISLYLCIGFYLSITTGITSDESFEQLNWENIDTNAGFQPIQIINHLNLKDIIMWMDSENRFVYEGSLTTPPCKTPVLWNVL